MNGAFDERIGGDANDHREHICRLPIIHQPMVERFRTVRTGPQSSIEATIMLQQPCLLADSKQPLPQIMTAADYLRWVELERPNETDYEQVRVVAHSPLSPAGRLLMDNLGIFARKGFSVRAVFTAVRSKSELNDALTEYDRAFGRGQAGASVRFANFKRQRTVRELMDIGKTAVKFGAVDTSLNALEVVSTAGDREVDFARRFAFDAIWEISSAPCC